MADYLTLNDIKPLVNIPNLIGDIEEGFIAKERILELEKENAQLSIEIDRLKE